MKSGLNTVCVALMTVAGCLSLSPEVLAGNGVARVRPTRTGINEVAGVFRPALLDEYQDLFDEWAGWYQTSEAGHRVTIREQFAEVIRSILAGDEGPPAEERILNLYERHRQYINSRAVSMIGRINNVYALGAADLYIVHAESVFYIELQGMRNGARWQVNDIYLAQRRALSDMRDEALGLIEQLTQ